jgi:hypothetical protein
LAEFASSYTPSNTVLLSKISGYDDKYQLLIPNALVPKIKFFVQCASRSNPEANAALGHYGVDGDYTDGWFNWNNVRGTPQR